MARQVSSISQISGISDTPPVHEERLRMSYEEWLDWAGESTQSEWVDGEAIIFMPPKTVHALVSAFLLSMLKGYADLLDLGIVIAAPFEMRLEEIPSSREPDLLFIARAHRDRLTPERLVGPADLLVELISNDSVRRDQRDKLEEYRRVGVPEYWIVDPRPGKQRASFYQLTAAGTYAAVRPDAEGRYHSAALPGFWFRPDWLWQDPLPNAQRLLTTIAPDAMLSLLEGPR